MRARVSSAISLVLLAFVSLALMLVGPAVRAETGPPSESPLVPFVFREAPGPHAVGLEVRNLRDASRSFRPAVDTRGASIAAIPSRPLQTLIWYPAKPAAVAPPMRVRDYVALAATETSFDTPSISSERMELSRGLAAAADDSLRAVRGAAPLPGRFPVVIYAPSFSSHPWENADLTEYLASHGYIVLAAPSMGADSRDMTIDLEGADAGARDISFLIGVAGTLPDADTSRIAVIGFSWGGLTNVFAAARDRRIDALVALDGSLRYFPGLVQQAGDVRPDQMAIPLLYLAQGDVSIEEAEQVMKGPAGSGPNVLNAWKHGDLVTVTLNGMTHGAFSSMIQRNPDAWAKAMRSPKGDFGRQDAIDGYGWSARYMLAFLDAYLGDAPAAADFLRRTPGENGVPRHMLRVQVRSAAGPPATLDAFRAALAGQGYRAAADLFHSFQSRASTFQLREADLIAWGDELCAVGKLRESVVIATLHAALYPDSERAKQRLYHAETQR